MSDLIQYQHTGHAGIRLSSVSSLLELGLCDDQSKVFVVFRYGLT